MQLVVSRTYNEKEYAYTYHLRVGMNHWVTREVIEKAESPRVIEQIVCTEMPRRLIMELQEALDKGDIRLEYLE